MSLGFADRLSRKDGRLVTRTAADIFGERVVMPPNRELEILQINGVLVTVAEVGLKGTYADLCKSTSERHWDFVPIDLPPSSPNCDLPKR